MTASRRSPRSTREAIRRHEDQQRELIGALLDSAAPSRHDLAYRLHWCQQARDVRRGWHDLRDVVSGDYPYQCRLLACWACRRAVIRRWKAKGHQRFVAAANDDCSMVDIALSYTSDVGKIRDIVGKARKDFGNLRAAAYQQPGGWRWHSVQVFGMVDVDVAVPNDAAPLTHDRSTPIPSFPVVAPAANTLWLPRANLAVHHPHLESAELARAVTHQWPGSERVIVRQFEEHQSAADNAADIVRRSLDTFRQTGVGGADRGWPARQHAEYHAWLFGLKRGLQPLGISSMPQREKDVLCSDDVGDITIEAGWRGGEIEPMPVLF